MGAILRKRTLLFAEAAKFLKSKKFDRILIKIQRKLGLVGVKEVDEYILLAIFRACSWNFEVFEDSEDSGWCSLFSSEDQKAYDYYVGLFNYYAYGPANQDTMDASCVLLQDIITNLERATKDLGKSTA